MSKQDILLNRFKFIKKMWLNSAEGSSEQEEWERKMDICLKELKKTNSAAANRARIDYGANVLSHYLIDTNGSREA